MFFIYPFFLFYSNVVYRSERKRIKAAFTTESPRNKPLSRNEFFSRVHNLGMLGGTIIYKTLFFTWIKCEKVHNMILESVSKINIKG